MNLKKNLPRTKLHDLKYRFKFFHLMNNRIQGNFSGLERGGGGQKLALMMFKDCFLI